MKRILAVSVISALCLGYFHIATAQQTTKPTPRIGLILSTGAPTEPSAQLEAFKLGLRDLGYVDGKNIQIDLRYAEGRLDRMAPFVHEYVQQKVDVILGVNNVVIRAAKEATTTIPIVIISSIDPVAAGYVQSYARPGGNITGLTWLSRELSAKRVELLNDILPKLSRVSVLWDADGPGPAIAFKEYQGAARAFKLDLLSLEVRGPNPDFVRAFQAASNAHSDAVIVVGNPSLAPHMKSIFALATKHRMPSMSEDDRYVNAGGLISYGANIADLYRRASEYVVEILKGAKPADLPVKLASKLAISINLKTAQQIGLAFPKHLLVHADIVVK